MKMIIRLGHYLLRFYKWLNITMYMKRPTTSTLQSMMKNY